MGFYIYMYIIIIYYLFILTLKFNYYTCRFPCGRISKMKSMLMLRMCGLLLDAVRLETIMTCT